MKLEHKELLESFDDDWQGDLANRTASLDDLKKLSGIGQWSETELALRKQDGRPAITVNLLPQFARQVANDIKQMRPSVDTVPVDDKTDPVISEIFDGLIRQIEYQSDAQAAYGHGGAMAVSCGIGHWRIETDFVEDSVFEQEIKVKRILDPLSVVWDAAAVEQDRSDAHRVNVTSSMTKDEFKRKFPKAKREAVDVPQGNETLHQYGYWEHGEKVRIAEHWYKEPYKRRLIMTGDFETVDATDMQDDQLALLHASVGIVGERMADSFKIKRVLLDGLDFLSDPEDWAGSMFPIIPVMGDEIAFEGQVVRSGIIRWAKDSQQAYNYWRSAAIEAIGNAPKAPWLLSKEHVEGFENIWQRANQGNLAYLPYNANPENPADRPTRERPADPPAALWQEANIARDEMKGVTGLYDASLGAQGNETSGKAIIARERQGDVGSYNFIDNFNSAIRRTGQVLINLIPKIYDTERMIRIIGKDEQEGFVPINKTVIAPDGQPVVINDISQARFDIRVKTGPSYTTQRVEAREQLAQALQGNPQLWAVIGDLVFKYSDFEGADQIAERLRRTMPPEVLGEDAPEQQPDPMAQMAQRLGMEKEKLALALDQVKIEQEQAKTEQTVADTQKTMVETQKEAFELGAMSAQV